AFLPRADHVASPQSSHAALAIDADVHDEIATRHERDPRVLLVNRIALDAAAIGFRVLQEAWPVPHLHGFEPDDAGTDHLSAAAVTGHQVRLDEPGRDLQFGT